MIDLTLMDSSGGLYDAAARLSQFRELRGRGALCSTVTETLATEAAEEFLRCFTERREYLADAITLLAEIATLDEPCLAEPGQRATFPILVERLSDSFDPRFCSLYDRAFAQMIEICRRLPGGAKLDAALRRFGLNNAADLLARKSRIRQHRSIPAAEREKVRKVVVLSRVTLGAEVAVTSIAIQKTKRSFPNAEVVILGSPKLHHLFGGDAQLRIREVLYRSDGSLLERLNSWMPLLEVVAHEIGGLSPEEYIVIDPDSRLLQLGLLPVAEDSRYFFLESRAFGALGDGSMSAITLRWLNASFGGSDALLPAVNLRAPDLNFARNITSKLRASGQGSLIALSLGVGGNPQKRLPDPFEERLLLALLSSGCRLLLDKGAGEEEMRRTDILTEHLRASGRTVIEADRFNAEEWISAPEIRCDVLTWHGEIGPFAALAGSSDEYIGYDSAGQHIAAAQGIPTVTVFTEAATPIFQERWMPAGPGRVSLVAQQAKGRRPHTSDEVLAEVMQRHHKNSLGGSQKTNPTVE